jgi:hypothetical protein
MTLVVITMILLAIAVVSFLVGTIWLSQYAARLGAGPRIMTLLLPPYAFYFAFYKLDQDTKHRPVFLWSFGIVTTIVLSAIFFQPLKLVANGQWDELMEPIPKEQRKMLPTIPPKIDAPTTPAAPAGDTAPASDAAPTGDAAPAADAAPAGDAAPADGGDAAPADGAAPAPN